MNYNNEEFNNDFSGFANGFGEQKNEYVYGDNSEYENIPVIKAEPEIQPVKSPEYRKKDKKERFALKIVALCLACSILGGVIGGAGANILGLLQVSGETELDEEIGVTEDKEMITQQSEGDQERTPIKVSSVSGESTQASEIYDENVGAVVGITIAGTTTNWFGQVTETAASGTGFIISEDGYILTNNHVVQSASKITVTLYDGNTYEAVIIGADSKSDIAVIKIEETGLQTVTLGNSDNIVVGENVAVIGHPLGELTYTLTTGSLSALDREINVDSNNLAINMFQIDAAVNSGNSGGPVFNSEGAVIGVVTAKYSSYSSNSVEGIGFAIPINDAIDVAEQLISNGYVSGRAYIGVKPDDLDAYVRAYYNIPAGAYVVEVVEGSCAEAAGLREGDMIVGLGEYAVTSSDELNAVKQNFSAGETTTITIYRSGEKLELPITFDEDVSSIG